MEEIIKLAESLGSAISASPVFAELKRLELEVRRDSELSKLTEEYQVQMRRIADLEKNQQPVEVEDKKKMQSIRESIQSDEKIQQLLKVQTEYASLMSRINNAITGLLQIDNEQTPDGK